jgi:hypothetical protein
MLNARIQDEETGGAAGAEKNAHLQPGTGHKVSNLPVCLFFLGILRIALALSRSR